jgi:hypothetical protein
MSAASTRAASGRPARRSRYDRPRRPVSWIGLLLGVLLGIVGGFVVTRTIAPAEEINTAPHQLRADDKRDYLVAIMLNWANDRDLTRAIEGLATLQLGGDPIARVAEIACELAGGGYVRSTSGERAIRAMMAFYQSQQRAGCADQLLPPIIEPTRDVVVVAATPTLPPPPTKTPTPEGQFAITPTTFVVAATVQPQRAFELIRAEPFCDPAIPGVIEVRVRARDGSPLPGQRVRARWDGGENVFITGVMSERGADYADFQMELERSYTVDMPGQADPSRPLVADPCFDAASQSSLTSYYLVFVPSAE